MRKSRERLFFTGLVVHREPAFGYSFFFPEGWHRVPIESDIGVGVAYLPDPADPQTAFSAEARDLGVTVEPDDLDDLRRGFVKGIRQLSGSRIQSLEAEAIGNLITMEARHTFREGGVVRKRWTRLVYHGSTQVRLVAQAGNSRDFGHWEPAFFQSMRSFKFGDWWADAIGAEWAESVFPNEVPPDEVC